RAQRREPLQRGIYAQVADRGERRQISGKRVRQNGQVDSAANRERQTEPQRSSGRNSSGREWPARSSPHARVIRPFDQLIERRCSSSNERRTEKRVKQSEPGELGPRRGRTHPEPGSSRDGYKERDLRLRERPVIEHHSQESNRTPQHVSPGEWGANRYDRH